MTKLDRKFTKKTNFLTKLTRGLVHLWHLQKTKSRLIIGQKSWKMLDNIVAFWEEKQSKGVFAFLRTFSDQNHICLSPKKVVIMLDIIGAFWEKQSTFGCVGEGNVISAFWENIDFRGGGTARFEKKIDFRRTNLELLCYLFSDQKYTWLSQKNSEQCARFENRDRLSGRILDLCGTSFPIKSRMIIGKKSKWEIIDFRGRSWAFLVPLFRSKLHLIISRKSRTNPWGGDQN